MVEIYDITGKHVMSFELPNSPETFIDISHLPAGMYLIKIEDKIIRIIRS